jgi:hypothetical protein
MIGPGGDRTELLSRARTLEGAGIRVFDIDPARGLLVRSTQAAEATRLLAEPTP